MVFLRTTTFALLLSALSTMVFAQEENPAFLKTCGPKTWALTFDDGPSPLTPELLGILKAANVKATFFVIGAQLIQTALRANTKAAFDAGHMIAAHSQDHSDFNTLTPDQIKQQLAQNNAEIKKTIGVETNYFRPPFGNCNAACAAVLQQLNYTAVTWDVDSNDWRVVGTPNEESAFNFFTTAIAAGSSTGHISLQHDIHQFSVKMVPKIIQAITAAGNTFVTVDKCGPNLPPPYRNGLVGNTTSGAAVATPTATPTPKSGAAVKSSASVSLLIASVLGGAVLAAM